MPDAASPSHEPVERRLRRLLAVLVVPGVAASLYVVWSLPVGVALRVCLGVIALLAWLFAAWLTLDAFTNPLRGLTNVVESLRAGDYSVRGRRTRRGDALGDLVHEINSLGNSLHEQRLRALEATALLERLIGAIDVAVFAVDGARRVRLCNPAGARLLGVDAAAAIGADAASFGLDALAADEPGTRVVTQIASRAGRWQVTHGTYREGGLAQHLLVVADVRQALRDEERAAWQRLIRVIGHEVNNSLTPIKSLAGTLRYALESGNEGQLPRADALEGLRVIEERTHALGRFLAAYSRLARLPAPQPASCDVAALLASVAALDANRAVVVDVEPDLRGWFDRDQVEQALINLVKNATEAAGPGGHVVLRARPAGDGVRIEVEDDGPGIANTDNLFVPFFTTKPGGSGIGLALSRQIAEGHGGTLVLTNRGTRGCRATLDLPPGP